MKRVRVRWHTTEVTDYEAVFEIPDGEVMEDDDLWDGDCALLIEYEDQQYEQHGNQFPAEFTRETDEIVEVPA